MNYQLLLAWICRLYHLSLYPSFFWGCESPSFSRGIFLTNLFSTSVLYMGVTEEQSLRNEFPSGYVFYWQNISLLHNPLEREIPATSE